MFAQLDGIKTLIKRMEQYPVYYKLTDIHGDMFYAVDKYDVPREYTFMFNIEGRIWFMKTLRTKNKSFDLAQKLSDTITETITFYNADESYVKKHTLPKFLNFDGDDYALAGTFPDHGKQQLLFTQLVAYGMQQDTKPAIVLMEQYMGAMYDKFSILFEELAGKIDALENFKKMCVEGEDDGHVGEEGLD